MVYTTMPGIVTDDDNASCISRWLWTMNRKKFGSRELYLLWQYRCEVCLGTMKKPVRKPAIHSSLITVYNDKFESQISKFLSPVYGW